MAYRLVYSEFWTDPKVMEEMSQEDKFFYLYILTNPSTTSCGIYTITKKKMAFELGHSIETINTLMDRFETHHKLITYNEETRELAIKNWGKYNLSRGGKPVMDCLTSELSKVKDKNLIKYVHQNIKSGVISDLYKSFYDTSTSSERQGDNTYTNTDTYTNTERDTDTNTNTSKEKERDTNTEKVTNIKKDDAIKIKRDDSINIKTEKSINTDSENNASSNKKESALQSEKSEHNFITSDELGKEDPNSLSISLLQEYEKVTGHIGELNLGAVKIAIIQHGYCNVKKAVNKALEKDKFSMSYINGILKTWAKEGYPKEENSSGIRNTCKNTGVDKNKFKGFKPKPPRRLTEEERKSVEEELL
jgi:DnaD/phage-associated family protein